MYKSLFLILVVQLLAGCSPEETELPRIERPGVIGVWIDPVDDSVTTLVRTDYSYLLRRVNTDGATGEYRMRRDGRWLKLNDSFGHRYQIVEDRLELFDNQGYIRTLQLQGQ